jgi:glycosyltransferase involved in cell wall biosynthesis
MKEKQLEFINFLLFGTPKKCSPQIPSESYTLTPEKGKTALLNTEYLSIFSSPEQFQKDREERKIRPLFSICIPTDLSRPEALKKAIHSWSRQRGISKELYELVIVINGFSPEKGKVITEIEELLQNLQLNYTLVTLKERGVGKARAISVSAAEAELLLLVNDDTVAEEELLIKHLKIHLSHPFEKIAVLGKFIVDPTLIKTPLHQFIVSNAFDFDQNLLKKGEHFIYYTFITNNLSVRKQFIYEVGNFNHNFFEAAGDDCELGLRFFKSGGRVIFDPEIIAYHYHNYLDKLPEIYQKRGKWYARILFEHNLLKEEYLKLSCFRERIEKIEEEAFPLAKKELLRFKNGELLFDRIMQKFKFLKGFLSNISKLCNTKPYDSFLPTVSVIIPVHNGEKYISESLQSLINQSYPNLEIVVVDDGSTDRTPEIVKEFSREFPQVTYLRQEQQGQGIARNNGVKISRGEYLMFLDADDIMLPYGIEFQVLHAIAGNYDMVYGDYIVFYEDTKEAKLKEMLSANDFESRILYQCAGNLYPIGTVLIKKETFLELKGFKGDLVPAEDFDLWNRVILSKKKIYKTPLPIYLYRVHPNQSSKNMTKLSISVDKALLYLLKKLKKNFPSLLTPEFIQKITELLLHRIESVPLATSYAIKMCEKLEVDKKTIRFLTKKFMRRYGIKPFKEVST